MQVAHSFFQIECLVTKFNQPICHTQWQQNMFLLCGRLRAIQSEQCLTITQFLTPTHAQLHHRLKFIKKPYKNYMFRSTTIFRELQYPR